MNKNNHEYKNDLVTGITFCTFSAWYYYSAAQIVIPKALSASNLDASSVPKLWGILLFLLGAAIFIRGMVRMNAARKENESTEKEPVMASFVQWIKRCSAAIMMFLVLIVYVLAIPIIGFLISTIVFLFLEFIILTRKEDRKLWLIIALSVFIGLGIYLLFRYGFSMPLPHGLLKLF